MKRSVGTSTPGDPLPRLRRSQALAAALSWVMALQVLVHGVFMLLPAGAGSGAPGVICSVNGPYQTSNGAGNAGGQLPPCCSSGNCSCLPGTAPLPSVPTIPRMAAPVHAPFRPILHQARARASGWQWQARAPPSSG